MKTNRLEAFSDGVIAVIITIMVLELHVPHVGTLDALLTVAPSLLVYGMSFAVVAIFWVNHHHLIEKCHHAAPAVLWSNNNMLFWMSLIPFATAYLGENCHAPLAVAVYGASLTLASAAYSLLQFVVGRQDPEDAKRRLIFRRMNRKAVYSLILYTASVPLAFVSVNVSFAIFVLIPMIYFWPEYRAAMKG